MLIGNLPEDTTPAPDGYVPYSEDGIHLNRISRDNLIKGAGHGTGMVYWEEGDGQIVTEGGHTNIPRTVVGSLYSYAIEDDGIAYWFVIYPATYWSSEITEEVRMIWELAYEDDGEINRIAYMDNRGNVNISGTNNAGAALESIKARNYVYVDEDGVETNLLDYFMTKFTVGDGMYMGGNNEDVLCAIGATQITINGMTFELQNDGSFDLEFGNEFEYNTSTNRVNGLTTVGVKCESGVFTNGMGYFVPHKSLFMINSNGKACPLSTEYGSTTKFNDAFKPDQLYYYDAAEDSYELEDLDSSYVFTSHKKVPINAMYNDTLVNGELYLVGTYQSDGYFYLDNDFLVQSIPSSENGKVYIFLGYVENDYLDLQLTRPKYQYINGGIRPYTYTPINDIYYTSGGGRHTLIGSEGVFGIQGSDTISVQIGSQGGNGYVALSVNNSALKPNLPINEMSQSWGATTVVGRNSLYPIPGGFVYGYANPVPSCYLNVQVIVRGSGGAALTGQKYKAWLSVAKIYNEQTGTYSVGELCYRLDTTYYIYILYECIQAIETPEPFDSSKWTEVRNESIGNRLGPVPYENGEGGYFIDSKAPISGDNEVVLSLSGMWKTDNYVNSNYGEYGPIVILETDTVEQLFVYMVMDSTNINVIDEN